MSLDTLTPSYLYAQYQDDVTLSAFVDAYNSLAQSYLDWFNDTPLAIYVLSSINGTLLDWVGDNLYQVIRPAISNYSSTYRGAQVMEPTATRAQASATFSSSGSSTLVSDDIYKRVLTWHHYKGDGMQASLTWLRRRVARFLYGSNGTDCDPSDYLVVDISYNSTITTGYQGGMNTFAMNTQGVNMLRETGASTSNPITSINLPNTSIGNTLYNLFSQGVLPVPFQANIEVTIA